MATIKSFFPISGTLGEFSFYQVKGKTIMRRKGGPTKTQFKRSERFAISRLNSIEFGGRAKASRLILRALGPLRSIADYNIAAALHKPLKAIQEYDTTNPLGKRSLSFSRHSNILQGLSLNTNYMHRPIIETINHPRIEPNGTTTIQIPHLIPGITLNVPGKISYFRICAVLAAVPDLHFTKKGYTSALRGLETTMDIHDTTPWLPAASVFTGHTFHLVPPSVPLGNDFVWMLTLGVEFGVPTTSGIVPLKGEGAGRLIGIRGFTEIEDAD